MIFGVSTASFFLNLYNEDAIIKIGQMGVKNIEVFFAADQEYNEDFVYEIKKRIESFGMNVYSVHALSTQFEPQLFSLHKRQQQDAYGTFERVLNAGRILGAEVYVFHGPTHIKIARKLEINYAYTASMVDKAANLAKNYGIKFTYETVHWCWFSRPEFAINLNKYITTDNLYYTLDIKQCAQSKIDSLEYIDAIGDRLVNIHLCDYYNSDDKGVVPVLPFKGQYDFERLRGKLKETNYTGGMILEVYRNNYKDYDELYQNYLDVVDFFS